MKRSFNKIMQPSDHLTRSVAIRMDYNEAKVESERSIRRLPVVQVKKWSGRGSGRD